MTYLSIDPIFRDNNQSKKVDHFGLTFDSDVKVWVFHLFQMYTKWAENNDIQVEVIEADYKPLQSKYQSLEYLSLERAILHFPTLESHQLTSEIGVHSAWKESGFYTGHHQYLALVSVSEKQSKAPCTQELQFLYNLHPSDSHCFGSPLLELQAQSCVREYCLGVPPGNTRRSGIYTSSFHPQREKEICVDYYAPENGKIEPFLTSFL